jgi:hypothetical protein
MDGQLPTAPRDLAGRPRLAPLARRAGARPLSAAQQVYLGLSQVAERARPQFRVAQGPDGDPQQPLHRVSEPLEHLAHLVRLPLADHHLPP